MAGEGGDAVERWGRWLDAEVRRVVDAAAASELGGDAGWDAVLAQWSVAPLSPPERVRHAQQGPPRRAGPAPIEVRWVLAAICRHVAEGLSPLEHQAFSGADDSEKMEQQLDRLRRRIGDLPNAELGVYIGRVRPRVTTSSIFANAMATSRSRPAVGQGPALATLTCACCGAPRREQNRSRMCEFCGSNL